MRPFPPPFPPKEELRAELERLLSADLATLERAQQATREAATHEEAKPENDKDTRALEQSYLARGQAKRVLELQGGLADVSAMSLRSFGDEKPAALGAIVTIEDNGEARVLLLAPYGGGLALANGAVQVVTPKSPLGGAILGKRTGDECEVILSGKTRELTIISVI